jgi:hypothetical protein
VPLDARSVNDAAYRNTYSSQLPPQTVAADIAKYAAKAASPEISSVAGAGGRGVN